MDGAHLPPFLVTKQDLDGFVGYKIGECLDEERERWFKVDAIGGEDHVIFVRDGWWERVTPDRNITGGYDDNGHFLPHESEGESKAPHQLSSDTVTVGERELSWTFWRMISRRGLVSK